MSAFCSNCGAPSTGIFCASCGGASAQAPAEAQRAAVVVAAPFDPMAAEVNDVVRRARTRHGVPALLSFFLPGLGQLVKGEVLKGIVVFLVMAFAVFLCSVFIGFILAPLFWIVQIYDAYTSPDAQTKQDLKLIEKVKRQSGTAA